MKILGIEVDEVNRQEAIEKISGWVGGKGSLKHVVTIYSEFLLAAEEDKDFRRAVEKADLVVPDGVGVLAAMEYGRRVNLYGSRIKCGMTVGGMGLRGELGEPVTGVWLFEELVRLAAEKDWKVFLLGGFGDTVERLARKLHVKGPTLDIGWDAGEPRLTFAKAKLGRVNRKNERVVEKINRYKPDLLMVAYGPVSQEKWIYENKKKLKVKVAIGVGGTFNEVLGEFARAPKWMEKRGLKAVWRLLVQPKRLPRIFRAMVVFPWRIYIDSCLRRNDE
ncbi:WecB/TagA/CpsF family glycosyltransferase [Patescibacteria group bacterium]|nr:WecB/TagA/CpsF family glycosyltransferase [Patescibacteria group bacterium]MBU1256596.1 WecB/TagA/CpsF family glycosyltransferase [Patescibacteria group bacterium]MBU1457917.1 WecB/TagA/CpsF family glycosyltransferase [Patescibacteria group bacterium]